MIGTHLKNASKLEKVARLKSWMPSVNYEDDQEVSNWIEEHHSKLSKRLEELKHDATRADLMKLLNTDSSAALAAVKEFVEKLPQDSKTDFLNSL